MAGKEILFNPSLQINRIGIDKPSHPFSNIECKISETDQLQFLTQFLRFGDIDFEARIGHDPDKTIDERIDKVPKYYINFYCSIKDLNQLKFLQKYKFILEFPQTENLKEHNALIGFDDIWPYEMEYIEEDLAEEGELEFNFGTEIENIPLGNKDYRDGIELKIIDMTSSPEQQKLPLELVT